MEVLVRKNFALWARCGSSPKSLFDRVLSLSHEELSSPGPGTIGPHEKFVEVGGGRARLLGRLREIKGSVGSFLLYLVYDDGFDVTAVVAQ